MALDLGLHLGLGMGGGLGPELVTDGAFTSTANWIEGAGWSVTGGKAVATAAVGPCWQVAASVTSGNTYRVTFTVSNYSAGEVQAHLGAAGVGPSRTANGTYTADLVASGSGELGIVSPPNFTGEVDDLSVRQVL